jgi:H+/Cl- antiporter ClcA
VFPSLFLGAAGGLMAAELPGFSTTPAVAVGLGAGLASALGLPLTAVVVATLLTAQAGVGAAPLIIVGVVVAYITTKLLSEQPTPEAATVKPAAEPADAAAPSR